MALCCLGLLLLGSCKEDDNLFLTYEEQLAIDEKLIQDYLDQHNITTATRTSTGLYYQVLRPGNGEQATKDKVVKIHYIGKFLDGTKFDSSYDTGIPYAFKVGAENGSTIKGWHHAVELMREGEEARFFVPSGLAYGRYGSSRVPPNAVLVFDMDLLDVQ